MRVGRSNYGFPRCAQAGLFRQWQFLLPSNGATRDFEQKFPTGLGEFTFVTEQLPNLVIDSVRRLRDMSPLYEMHKEGIDLKSIQWAAH